MLVIKMIMEVRKHKGDWPGRSVKKEEAKMRKPVVEGADRTIPIQEKL